MAEVNLRGGAGCTKAGRKTSVCGTNWEIAPRARKPTENLNLIGRSQDFPDKYRLLSGSLGFEYTNLSDEKTNNLHYT
jgi:hypothetical protein